MLYAIVALLVVIVDQWVKFWVAGAIPLSSTGETFIPGIISLVNLRNDGAAFGFLAGGEARIPFIIIAGVFAVLVIIALATKFVSGPLARWCLVLVAAGGVSNCIDRVINGYVQDMFKCELFNFPVFNVADIFITVFCILFILAILFERPRKDADEEYDELFDEDEEEEEEEPPRVTAKERRAARRAAAQAEEDEDDDEDIPPVRAAHAAPAKESRKTRQAKYDDEYEQYKAARAARQQAEQARQTKPAAAVQTKPDPAYDPADPFAEWERATQQVETQQAARQQAQPRKSSYSALDPDAVPAKRPSAAAQRSAQSAQSVQKPTQATQKPAQAAPVSKPKTQTRPAQAGGSDEFSLEDILAEFK